MVCNATKVPQLPEGAAWKLLIKDANLDETQERELRGVLVQALLDLDAYFKVGRSRQERKAQINRLNRFYLALKALVDDLEDDAARLEKALPFDAQEAIGLWLADQAIRVANNRPRMGGQAIHVRRSAGLKQPVALLTAALTEIKAPIDAWIAQYQPDPGGRWPNVVREFLIISLANHSEAIIRAPASSTAEGPFEDLCTRVLDAFGENSEGLKEAIDRALQKRSANPILRGDVEPQ